MSALPSDSLSELLTVDDLSRVLRKAASSIRSDISRNRAALPPLCRLPGTNRTLWRRKDVEAWIAAHVVTPPPPTTVPHKRRGAPTKAERIAKQAAQ